MSLAGPARRDDSEFGGSGRTSSPAASSRSILAGAGPADVHGDPFSHLVRKDCLPAATYQDLAATFPSSDIILGDRKARVVNAAARLPAFKVLDNAAVASAWREFFHFHTSDGFWKD